MVEYYCKMLKLKITNFKTVYILEDGQSHFITQNRNTEILIKIINIVKNHIKYINKNHKYCKKSY